VLYFLHAVSDSLTLSECSRSFSLFDLDFKVTVTNLKLMPAYWYDYCRFHLLTKSYILVVHLLLKLPWCP